MKVKNYFGEIYFSEILMEDIYLGEVKVHGWRHMTSFSASESSNQFINRGYGAITSSDSKIMWQSVSPSINQALEHDKN